MTSDYKSLTSLLPKIRVLTPEEDYLASLTEADRKRFYLQEYFRRQRKRNPKKPDQIPFSWVVLTEPFPQLFEYSDGDEDIFMPFKPIRFQKFKQAYSMYKALLYKTLQDCKDKRTAGHWTNHKRTDQ